MISFTAKADVSWLYGEVNQISVGDIANINVTLNTNAAPIERGAKYTTYNLDYLSINIGSYNEIFSTKSLLIRNNDLVGGFFIDEYHLEGSSNYSYLSLSLLDTTGTVFSNSNLPTDIPSLSFYQLGSARPSPFAQDDLSFRFKNNYTITGGVGGTLMSLAAPVPEVDTSAMLLMGIGLMFFVARRRQQA